MKRILVIVLIHVCVTSFAQQIEVAVQKGHSGDVLVVAFNHDGKLLASAGTDNLIKLWHIPTGKEMVSFISASTQNVVALKFKGENDFLLVKYKDGTVHTWNITESKLESQNTRSDEVVYDPHLYKANKSSFTIELDRYFLRKK